MKLAPEDETRLDELAKRSEEHAAAAAYHRAHCRPGLFLETRAGIERFETPSTSYFGGSPSLPSSELWPYDRHGCRALFYAQLDCAEISRLLPEQRPADGRLPETGFLYFFLHWPLRRSERGGRVRLGDAQAGDPSDVIVYYLDAPAETPPLAAPPPDYPQGRRGDLEEIRDAFGDAFYARKLHPSERQPLLLRRRDWTLRPTLTPTFNEDGAYWRLRAAARPAALSRRKLARHIYRDAEWRMLVALARPISAPVRRRDFPMTLQRSEEEAGQAPLPRDYPSHGVYILRAAEAILSSRSDFVWTMFLDKERGPLVKLLREFGVPLSRPEEATTLWLPTPELQSDPRFREMRRWAYRRSSEAVKALGAHLDARDLRREAFAWRERFVDRAFEPVTAEERADFVTWCAGWINAAQLQATRDDDARRALRRTMSAAGLPIRALACPAEPLCGGGAGHALFTLDWALLRATRDLLDHSAETARGAPAAFLEEIAPKKQFASMRNAERALGYGDVEQNAAELHRNCVMLLQTDLYGDEGKLQFWIRPEDVAARRWDKAFSTYENS